MNSQQALVEKIMSLPPDKVEEVNKFVDLILDKPAQAIPSKDPLLSVAGILSGEPLCSEELELELYNA